VSERLFVIYDSAPIGMDDTQYGDAPGKKAWRVAVQVGRQKKYPFLPIPFARKEDAELAKQALQEASLNTVEKIRTNKARVARICFESLRW